MAEKQKSFGKKIKDLFIVDENGQEEASDGDAPRAAASDVDDLIARYASPDAAPKDAGRPAAPGAAPAPGAASSAATRATLIDNRGASPPPPGPPPPGADREARAAAAVDPSVPPAKVDFPAVYQKGGVSAEEQSRVERTLTLLNNLPKDTPKEVKRQIVEASLVAFGIPVDQIIEAALLHQRALDRHVEKGQLETQQLIDESNQRLKDLEKQMADIRQRMQERFHGQQGLAAACGQQRFTVQEVLDFFGQEAVDRVSQLSVKLRGGGPTPPSPAGAPAPVGGERRR